MFWSTTLNEIVLNCQVYQRFVDKINPNFSVNQFCHHTQYFGVAAQLQTEELPTVSDVIRQAK